jgi:dsDNA-specific endonuclease/ATPase MutS2
MVESLSEIKGVGEKIKEQLISNYGNESEALRALDNQEFDGLLEAGLAIQKAMEIARFIASRKYGFTYSPILKTREAREIFNEIFEMLGSYPRTDYGKIGVGLLHPTVDKKEIERRQEYVETCRELAKRLEDKRGELSMLLSEISHLKGEEPKIDDIIAMEDPELYANITSRFQKKGNFILIERIEDLEYIRDFEFVRYVQRNAVFADQAMDIPSVEPVYDDDLEAIVPELVISFFGENRDCITSAIRIAELSMVPELLQAVKGIGSDVEVIQTTRGEGITKTSYPGIDKLNRAIRDIEAVADESLNEANATLSEKIKEMTIKGEEVLELIRTSGTSTVLESLPSDFTTLITSTADRFEEETAAKLGIDKVILDGVLKTDSYPLEVDGQRLSEIRQVLGFELKKLEFNTKQGIAKMLTKHISSVRVLVRKTMELDLKLAIGEFSIDQKLVQPEIQEELGVGFRGGRNLFLKGNIQPVDYVIGKSKIFSGKKERAVVITGANSGGKTTLLQLITQAVILTQMGLGVPADESVSSLFEEVYYFGKSQGTDAGAFETLLKTFGELSKSAKGRLILADEIEAITEPGAAAKILVAILDWFKEDKTTLIAVVTHLGEDIKEHVGKGVRIDGIEASGLDDELNLMVNRNPTLGKVAKSTPELILERLSRTSTKKNFYNWILKRFKN